MKPNFHSRSEQKCTAVVVTYNSATTVADLIQALNAQAEFVKKIVVVDNGSVDSTLLELSTAADTYAVPIHVIESENTGFAGGYARAAAFLEEGDGPVLCINPDVKLEHGAAALMLEALELDSNMAIVTVPLIGADGSEDTASRRRLPTLGGASLYGVLGKLLPRRWRYNSRPRTDQDLLFHLHEGTPVSRLDATTGALMMVSPSFRLPTQPIFDTDYWMYGEDLQLCLDARNADRVVAMVEMTPSIHLKGVSSGWPRSKTSHRAFHEALYIYYSKNLRRGPIDAGIARIAIRLREHLTAGAGHLSQMVRH